MSLNLVQRQRLTGAGLSAPPVAYLLIFFVAPSLLLLLYSVWTAGDFTVSPEFTLENYRRALHAEAFYQATWTGFKNGLCTAFVCVVTAFPVAYYIVYRAKTNLIFYAILLSWFSSYLVRVYAWRTILGTNGLINSTLMNLGVIDEPLRFLLFSPFATTITLIHIMYPFALLLLVSALRDIKRDYLDAARDLGATSAQMLARVILPMSHKGLVGAFMFTFILSAGDYITPQLLGGGEGVTSGLLIANQFRSAGNWPLGAAMAFLLLCVFATSYVLFVVILRACRLSPGRRYHDPVGK